MELDSHEDVRVQYDEKQCMRCGSWCAQGYELGSMDGLAEELDSGELDSGK
jgi:hypothetical protein